LEHSRLESISIKNLFGIIPEHLINLHTDGITFIHGPNGCGKTTCLRLIDAIFNWQFSVIREIVFESIEVRKSDGDKLLIRKNNYLSNNLSEMPITFKMNAKEYEHKIETIPPRVRLSTIEIEDTFPHLVRHSPREWEDTKQGIILSYDEVLDKYFDYISKEALPDFIKNFIDSVNLHFIKTQRLIKINESSLKRSRLAERIDPNVIQEYSQEIKTLINVKLAEQASVSQQRDRTFPSRLLNFAVDREKTEEEIRKIYSGIEAKTQKLVDAGLVEEQVDIDLPNRVLDISEKRVLTLYLEDIQHKLSVFNELQNQIEIFLTIINSKFKSKNLSINRENGFCIKIEKESNKINLLPTQLSSGEQHQIVLFYELIFKSSENSMFLIDEPEISLHVDWQRMFVEDIHKIASLGNRQFLIATHSPQIIGNNREVAIALDSGILDGSN